MKKTDFEKDLINSLRSLKTSADANPSVFFRENTKIRLMNLISEEKVLENKSSFVFIRNPKFAFRLAGIFLLILVFVSTGTILAAQSANPKNSLYPVKLASEEIALTLSPSPALKANVAVGIAKRRGDEIALEEKSNNKLEIKHEIEKYKKSINQARIFVPASYTNLNHELEHEEDNLNELTHRYENSGQTENQTESKQKVEGASDSKINQSEQTGEQKIEIKQSTQQQNSIQETTNSEVKTQSSSSDSIEKTTQEIKNTENNMRATETPAPERY